MDSRFTPSSKEIQKRRTQRLEERKIAKQEHKERIEEGKQRLKSYNNLVNKYKGLTKSERQQARKTCPSRPTPDCKAVIEAIKFHGESIF